jgi:hypothetical protein
MKKILLLLIFTFTTLNVYAEWVKVAENPMGENYLNTDSLKRKGNIVSYWEMIDFKVMQKVDNTYFLSMIYKVETNCDKEQSRTLYSALYPESMGQGRLISGLEHNNLSYTSIVPDTTEYVTFKFVCNKK